MAEYGSGSLGLDEQLECKVLVNEVDICIGRCCQFGVVQGKGGLMVYGGAVQHACYQEVAVDHTASLDILVEQYA